jgi:hypothetical protein
MKEFLVGLLFLGAIALCIGMVVLLFPLLFVMAFALRIVLFVSLLVLLIWGVGKLVVFVWEKLLK